MRGFRADGLQTALSRAASKSAPHVNDGGFYDAALPFDLYSSINEDKVMFEIKHYLTRDERDLFAEWRKTVKDVKTKIAIDRRIYRVEMGNFGDHAPCREGVWELRIDMGAGYRVYYAQAGKTVVLLLCGGTKRTQNADISKACEYWQDWQVRKQAEEKKK
jgi:putative addiction module killer protein